MFVVLADGGLHASWVTVQGALPCSEGTGAHLKYPLSAPHGLHLSIPGRESGVFPRISSFEWLRK